MDQIKLKKAVTDANKRIELAKNRAQTACGNAKLNFSINWSDWNRFHLKPQKHRETIRYVGSLISNDLFGLMKTFCQDAPLFKKVITKITQVTVVPKPDFEDMYIDYNVKADRLNVAVNPDGYGSWKNREFFQNAW